MALEQGIFLPMHLCSFFFFSLQLYRPSFVPPGPATMPTMSAAYPGTSLFLPVAQSVAVGPIGSSVPMAYYPVGPVYPPGSAVLVEGGFDAGARFGAGATTNIPVSMSIPQKPHVSLLELLSKAGSRGQDDSP